MLKFLESSHFHFSLVTFLIQGTNLLTFVYTPGESFRPQPYPQEVMPKMIQRPFDL